MRERDAAGNPHGESRSDGTAEGLLLGRDPEADVVIDHSTVSWHHARLYQRGDVYTLRDLGSTNGTRVNGERITTASVTRHDRVRLGEVRLDWAVAARRLSAQRRPEVVLESVGLQVRAPHGPERPILEDISFRARGGQVLAIIGPSGAGKSTFLRCLVGQLALCRGALLCNGVNLSLFPEAVWSWVGYVPQDDIVHGELRVRDSLTYACQLRTANEHDLMDTAVRVLAAADLCDLARHLDRRISTLSGGERKRASVAVELLTRPPILVFDEPTSGLDPALETSFMELCRRLADEGHLVIITTHVTRNLGLCDRALVLDRGRMACFGPPDELCRFFGVGDPADLYAKLDDGTDWPTRFRHSSTFRKYVARSMARETHPTPPTSGGLGSWLRQWTILLRRYLAILRGDQTNVAILTLQAPVIGAITAAVFPADAFTAQEHLSHATGLLFVITIAALWFGASNSAREIVKEAGIYSRERTLGLSIPAYVLSKLVPLSLLGCGQSAVLVAIVALRTDCFGDASPHAVVLLWALLSLAAACGVSIGLVVSAYARSPDQAISLTPVVLLPQIVFSGIFQAVEEKTLLKLIAKLVAANWTFGGLGSALDLNQRLASSPLTAPATRECFDTPVAQCLAVLAAMFVGLGLIAWLALETRRGSN